MNSNKLLRIGMPVLGICVLAVLSGCRSEVLSDRPSVPPAEREMVSPKDDSSVQEEKSVDTIDKKTEKNTVAKDGKNFNYPKFEDTDHTPIYSTPKTSGKKSAAGSKYVVVRGDTLGKIAARHGVKTIDLAKANDLQLNSVIRIGQKLTIPDEKTVSSKKTAKNSSSAASSSTKNSAPRSGLYTVRRGDSIYIIAKRCKVKRADLMAVNNLTENSVLRIGQTLKLPGAETINDEAVIVEKTTTAETSEGKKSDAPASNAVSDDDILKEIDGDTSATDKKSTETESAPSAETKSTSPGDGSPVEINQDIHINDFCKKHNISKEDLIKINADVNENTTILKAGSLLIVP